MAVGPGKYDDECTMMRELTSAECVVLMIGGGSKGSGFSVQTSLEDMAKLPGLLRKIADEIEADHA